MNRVILVVVLLLSVGLLLAQEPEPHSIPQPIQEELPDVINLILGAVAAFITEFVQTRKSPLASLGIAAAISAVVGGAASFMVGVGLSDLPGFIVQTFTMATAVWAVLFKGAGISKLLKTNAK